MGKFLWAGVATLPVALLTGYLYEVNQWEFWAIFAAASWWRFVGPLSD